MAEDFTLTGYARHGASHPNPSYDFLTGFAPRKVKDLFRWVEYLFYNSPTIFSTVQKFATYAVTEVKVDTPHQTLRTTWTTLLKNLKAKGVAIQTGVDLRLYGNSFISVYKPFNRRLKCNLCGELTGIRHVKYTFQLKTLKFKYRCAACQKDAIGTIDDQKALDPRRIAIIRWDPKLMDINYNPITGASKYYYTIPGDLQMKVTKGDKHIIDTMPIEFLKAIQEKKEFEFADGQIYHMKMPCPAGIDAQWGLPPLTAVIKLFFYAAVLRKANEAIALDHIVPFRVLHPAPISGTADPAMQINLASWQAKLEANIKEWRRDPLHIMFAPTALGVTMMGGQGRTLMTLGELKEANDEILAGMSVPREFVYGGLTVTGSAISLRMLENQLDSDVAQQNDQLEWIIAEVAKVLKLAPVKAKYIPFRLVDDVEQKQLTMTLQQMLGEPLSKETLLAPLGHDLAEERKKKLQELLDETRAQLEVQREIQKLQNSASQQAQAQAQSGAGLGYNAQAVMASADQLAQQMAQLDMGTRRSQMDQLSQEDPVMFACVKDRLETMAQQTKQQAVAQAQQGGGAAT